MQSFRCILVKIDRPVADYFFIISHKLLNAHENRSLILPICQFFLPNKRLARPLMKEI